MSNVNDISEEGNLIRNQTLSLFVGEQIGSGAYRRVYECVHDDSWVVKVEYCGREFCNIAEMQVWNEVKGTPIEHYFAPCQEVDVLGLALVQRRCRPFTSEKSFKKAIDKYWGGKVPDFFDDVHYGNFGLFEENDVTTLVCIDYGFNHFSKKGVDSVWKGMELEEGETEKQLGLL